MPTVTIKYILHSIQETLHMPEYKVYTAQYQYIVQKAQYIWNSMKYIQNSSLYTGLDSSYLIYNSIQFHKPQYMKYMKQYETVWYKHESMVFSIWHSKYKVAQSKLVFNFKNSWKSYSRILCQKAEISYLYLRPDIMVVLLVLNIFQQLLYQGCALKHHLWCIGPAS